MSFDLNTIAFILMMFILSLFVILLLHIGRHNKSNIFLAIYFISQILAIAAFLRYSNPLYFSTGSVLSFMWGGLFYFFISSLFNPDFRFRPTMLLHFIPAFILMITFIFYYTGLLKESHIRVLNWIDENFYNLIKISFCAIIFVYNLIIINRYLQFIRTLREGLKPVKNYPSVWIKVAVFGFVISCLISISSRWPGIIFIGNLAFLIYFSVLFYVAIVDRIITEAEKYKKSPLDETLSNEILDKIENYMRTKKPYTDPELSLRNLSAALNIHEKYLSEVINKLKGQNFSGYVNAFRISYAMELLKKPEYRKHKILYILFEAGFNSKTTFNTSFKKITGYTPLEYKKKFNS